MVLLRVVQEALNNVRKHAGASSVTIGLAYGPDEVSVEVHDDGVGFDVAGLRSGYGLGGMHGPGRAGRRAARHRQHARRRHHHPNRGASMIKVMIVDDHPIVRAGLVGILAVEADLDVVGEAASADEAVTAARALLPDVVLMDLRMPGGDGVTATAGVLAAAPAARVVVLTTYESDADIVRAVEAGAAGYLLKDATRADLVAAIRAAARGETVLAPSVATRLVDRMRRPPSADQLSPRELEVLRLVARGLSNADIGRELFISEATVKTHLLRTFAKLGVSDRTAAVTTALAAGHHL